MKRQTLPFQLQTPTPDPWPDFVTLIRFTMDTDGYILNMDTSGQTFFKLPQVEQSLLQHMVAPADQEKLMQLLISAREGLPAQASLQFVAGGSARPALLTVAPAYQHGVFTFFHCLLRPEPSWGQLAAIENKLKTIFEHDLECVKILSLEGILMDVNPMGIKLMGAQSKEALVGKNYVEQVVPEDRHLFAMLLQKAQWGESYQAGLRIINNMGELHWVEAKTAPLRNNSQHIYAVLMMTNDVTSRKVAENNLIASQQLAEENARKMMAIAESMLDCVVMIDNTGLIDYCNRNTEKLIGLHRQYLLGRPLQQVLQLMNATNYTPFLEQALKDQVPVFFEGFYQPCQSWFEANIYPCNGGISVSFKNITERKEAALKLELSEQKFKAMVQKGSDIIAVIDDQNRFTYLSPNSFYYAGYQPEDLVGQDLLQYIHPDDLSTVAEEIRRTKEGTHPGSETQHRFLHQHGHYIWLESKASNLLYEKHIEGIIINARDITHHKELEAQLAQEVHNRQKEITTAVIQAQERERSQIGQELHDNINQVLTTIKLYNEMIQQGIGNPNELTGRSIHHLQQCIDEIRSISRRLSAPTLGQISLSDSVFELAQSVNLTKRLRVRYYIDSIEHLDIAQDLHLTIYRILQEQLSNILKYAQAKNATIHITGKDNGLLLIISDDGIGFNPQKKSSGIGITNMRTRAESFNGRFSLSSKKGKGCVIEVFFPVHSHLQPDYEHTHSLPSIRPTSRSSYRKVLN